MRAPQPRHAEALIFSTCRQSAFIEDYYRNENMIDCQKIVSAAEEALQGTDLFVVECTCTPANEVELLIDSDTSVSIDACAELNRKIEALLDRDTEDFSLTVASAGIGSELKLHRQYVKLIGKPVEVLLKSGVKLLATLQDATPSAITLVYEEKVAVEGKKRKQTVETVKEYALEEVKYTKEHLDYK